MCVFPPFLTFIPPLITPFDTAELQSNPDNPDSPDSPDSPDNPDNPDNQP